MSTFYAAFGSSEHAAAEALLQLALQEDLGDVGDLTCQALIGPHIDAEVHVVARESGVISGLQIGELVFRHVDRHVSWLPIVGDGEHIEPGQTVARVAGRLSGILAGERTALNFLGCLSGIATQTSRYVEAVAGTFGLPGARIVDPGSPETSVLSLRLHAEGDERMPALGSLRHDEDGIALVDAWIAGLADCP